MKKYFVFLFCLGVAVLLNACAGNVVGKKPTASSVGSVETVQTNDISSSDPQQSSDGDPTGVAPVVVSSSTSSAAATSTGAYALKDGDIVTVENWNSMKGITDPTQFPKKITIIVTSSHSTQVAKFEEVATTSSSYTCVNGLTLNGNQVLTRADKSKNSDGGMNLFFMTNTNVSVINKYTLSLTVRQGLLK
jgi:hypothetical protein